MFATLVDMFTPKTEMQLQTKMELIRQFMVSHLPVIFKLRIFPSSLPAILDFFKTLQKRMLFKQVEALRYLYAAILRFTDEDDKEYVAITANLGNYRALYLENFKTLVLDPQLFLVCGLSASISTEEMLIEVRTRVQKGLDTCHSVSIWITSTTKNVNEFRHKLQELRAEVQELRSLMTGTRGSRKVSYPFRDTA